MLLSGKSRWAAVVVAVGVGALTLAGSSAYAEEPPEVFIVGGQQATEDMEWVAALHTDQFGFRCGAVLVAPDFLATNAHRLGTPPGQPPAEETYYARIGSLDRTHGGHLRRVVRVLQHPEFNWHQPDPTAPGADIALQQLDEPVPAQPVSVAPFRASQPVRVTGWGFEHQPPPDTQEVVLPTTMRYTDMVAVDDAQCSAADIRADEHCVRAPAGSEAGPCFGDSGSASLQRARGRWVFVGMVNRGVHDQCGTTPSVMTDASEYSTWITQTILLHP